MQSEPCIKRADQTLRKLPVCQSRHIPNGPNVLLNIWPTVIWTAGNVGLPCQMSGLLLEIFTLSWADKYFQFAHSFCSILSIKWMPQLSVIERSSWRNPLPEWGRSQIFHGNFHQIWNLVVNVHWKFYICLIMADGRADCSFYYAIEAIFACMGVSVIM